jgi:hypothetical protein
MVRACPLLSLLAVLLVSFCHAALAAAGDEVRSELSLASYTVGITYDAALSDEDPVNRAVAVPAGDRRGRVRVARLDLSGQMKIGDITIGSASPPPQSFDIWLEAVNGEWQLSLARTTDPITEVARVILPRRTSSSSPRFVASLLPVGGTRGRLMIRWGRSEGATDFTVLAAPRNVQQAVAAAERAGQPAAGRQGQQGVGRGRLTNRAHDADNSVAGRARILAQRNESAVVFPGNHRVSATFQRSAAPGEASAAGRGRGLSVDGPDYARLASTPDNAVVTHTQGPVPRLVTEAPLRFGTTTIPTGNLGKEFPGSYGLWLKRSGTSWRLVFNNEPDVWGTQHNARSDASEIALQHSEGPDAARPFAVAFAPTGPDRGRLLIMWGPHEWSADFTVGN